ncbi:MAG TPA: hypothetical protein VGN10_06230 [Pyrinomonadaceae bacterium]|jgi:hypothetical protein
MNGAIQNPGATLKRGLGLLLVLFIFTVPLSRLLTAMESQRLSQTVQRR